MRVLLLTQVAPNPPDAGPKAKTHYVLRMLAQRHEVDLVTFVRNETEATNARALGACCASVTTIPLRRSRIKEPLYAANGWAMAKPFLIARDFRQTFAQAVSLKISTGKIDVLHADQVTMGQYLFSPRRERPSHVFDAHNAVWELVRGLAAKQSIPVHRLGTEIEWRLLKRFEGEVCRRSDLTFAVSKHDLDSLTTAAGKPFSSALVPIGVEIRDVEFNLPRPENKQILSVATMHYPPNAEAIRWYRDQIWPIVKRSRTDGETLVVGPRPPADLLRWGESDQRVVIPGYVKNLNEIYRAAAVFIVPLLSGSGVRVKILDAMARGVPVVSTSVGAEGLELEPGRHILIADSPSDFAAAVVSLLDSPSRRIALARAAREQVLERYDWRICCAPVLDAYEQLSFTADRTAGTFATVS